MFSRNFFECLQPEFSSFLLLRVDLTGLQIINVNSNDVDNQVSYKPQQQGATLKIYMQRIPSSNWQALKEK